VLLSEPKSTSTSSHRHRGIEQDGLPIILKVLKPDYPTPAELIRYRQEYEVTRLLNLEVIKVYNQHDYQRTLVMMLEDIWRGVVGEMNARFPTDVLPNPFTCVSSSHVKCRVLGRIHAVIHKDINPSNIVLNPGTGHQNH